jgi:hypothetical protein
MELVPRSNYAENTRDFGCSRHPFHWWQIYSSSLREKTGASILTRRKGVRIRIR